MALLAHAGATPLNSVFQTWPQLFEQQGRGKVGKTALIRDGQHRAQPFEIDAMLAHLVPPIHHQLADFFDGLPRLLLEDLQDRGLSGGGAGGDEVDDLALRLAGNSAVASARFSAPITDVVIPDECQSIPSTHPNA